MSPEMLAIVNKSTLKSIKKKKVRHTLPLNNVINSLILDATCKENGNIFK